MLEDGEEKDFQAGDVARFAEGDVHGLRNDLNEEFILATHMKINPRN